MIFPRLSRDILLRVICKTLHWLLTAGALAVVVPGQEEDYEGGDGGDGGYQISDIEADLLLNVDDKQVGHTAAGVDKPPEPVEEWVNRLLTEPLHLYANSALHPSTVATSSTGDRSRIQYLPGRLNNNNKQPFNGLFSKTTWVSRYQKGKTNLDFTGARDSEWQWHHLGHMQVCTSLQTDNHASTPPLCFYRPDALPAAQPTASKHWRHLIIFNNNRLFFLT